jgi:DNA mismatch endonuclease (patch repair protein)
MTDVLTREQRSYNMSRIKARDTKPEIKLGSLLSKRGIRGYKTHYHLPGTPDIVFVKKRLAVFIDGCFWHKCPKCFKKPATRTHFWMKKIKGNVLRDKEVNKRLKKDRWKVLRFWEHEIRKSPEKALSKIVKCLKL